MTRECLIRCQRSFFSVLPRQLQKTAHFGQSCKVFGKEILDAKSPRRNITVNLKVLSAKSDHHQISPCHINAESVVMRITDMITQDEFA